MKILRIALGMLVGAYGLFNLIPIGSNAWYKAGLFKTLPDDLARMVPLWEATAWWELAVWTGVVALWFVTAWRLIRGHAALGFYVVALFVDAVLWWIMHASSAYQQVFSPAELQQDYITLVTMAVVAVAIWRFERPGDRPAAA